MRRCHRLGRDTTDKSIVVVERVNRFEGAVFGVQPIVYCGVGTWLESKR
jgi:hypothetical protein